MPLSLPMGPDWGLVTPPSPQGRTMPPSLPLGLGHVPFFPQGQAIPSFFSMGPGHAPLFCGITLWLACPPQLFLHGQVVPTMPVQTLDWEHQLDPGCRWIVCCHSDLLGKKVGRYWYRQIQACLNRKLALVPTAV